MDEHKTNAEWIRGKTGEEKRKGIEIISSLKLFLRNKCAFVWNCEISNIFVEHFMWAYFMTAIYHKLIYLFMFKKFKLPLCLVIFM